MNDLKTMHQLHQDLGKENYQYYFDRLMTRREQQVSDFVAQVNADLAQANSPARLDFTPDSLNTAWEYVRDHIEFVNNPSAHDFEQVPEWLWMNTRHRYFTDVDIETEWQDLPFESDKQGFINWTDTSLDLLDKLMFYNGEVIIHNVPNARWVSDLEDLQLNHTDVYRPCVANYQPGIERDEGYKQHVYIYISGMIMKHLKGKPNNQLKDGYDIYYEEYQYFLNLPDEKKYPPPPDPVEVTSKKKRRGWNGFSDLEKTQGYYDVWVTEIAELELGAGFEGLDKQFEAIEGVEEVLWYDRECMQIAAKLTKKALSVALNATYKTLQVQHQVTSE